MKKAFSVIACIFCCFGLCACNNDDLEVSPDKVYLFYQESCPHCHNADNYIKQKYPSLYIKKMNIVDNDARELFIKCAKKFNLGNTLGTPLICLGDNYIMGWSKRNEKKFDRLITPFLNE